MAVAGLGELRDHRSLDDVVAPYTGIGEGDPVGWILIREVALHDQLVGCLSAGNERGPSRAVVSGRRAEFTGSWFRGLRPNSPTRGATRSTDQVLHEAGASPGISWSRP